MSPRDPDELDLDAARTSVGQPSDSPETALTRRVGAVARSLSEEDQRLDEPPRDLWDRIAARATTDRVDQLDVTPPPGRRGPGDHVAPPAVDEPAETPARVVPIGPAHRRHPGRRPRRTGWLIGAAAAAVLAVAGVVAVVSGDGDGGAPVARAELDPLPAALPGTETASASLVERDGTNELDLPLDVPTAPGFYEVWLIDENVDGMVSLGPVRSDGRYEIPAAVDVSAFPIVDVSIEPADGVPTHSGRSVLRGTLS
jgi:hypothetical protein